MFEDMEFSLSPTFRNGVVSATWNSSLLENISYLFRMVELSWNLTEPFDMGIIWFSFEHEIPLSWLRLKYVKTTNYQ